LVDIKYRFPKLLQDPWFIYGIQIQAGKLKLFTEYVNPKNGETERKRKSENIAKELFNQNLWFDILLDKSTILYGDIYPIKNKEKLFNHFSPSFFYRYRNIIPGISVESLLDTIKGFQNYVIKEKEAIAKIIQGNL